ncbi:MBL fold metallo-hydrolase [Crassaminicella profunda]|uniref:MBL fold metallo-hydrolase n=1 Tax=Crassaminicella profunda TaxID=1286698 RepID=UPI001CA669BC|nr:MBL fold metallo-hydrolase [Crassaminicella profunda]QZY55275.1 MBL fold metallo-hydrolase [Crassaminicella profunda]
MLNNDFSILFWGVRGSTPSPNKNTIQFGGNTPCVQIQAGKHLLILDAGTGICQLGKSLIEQKEQIKAHIFISHVHWDHIQGIPFFLPLYEKNHQFIFYGEKKDNTPFSQIIKNIMTPPYFPITWDEIKADCTFYEIYQDKTLHLDDHLTVKTLRLNHPDDALGFRIEFEGKSCCYISDIEHQKTTESQLIQFIKNTDILIYDANFTEEEYIHKKGWGHSTWQNGVKIAKKAYVKKLILFHHDPYRYDEELESIETQAKKIYPNTFAAKEGMHLFL